MSTDRGWQPDNQKDGEEETKKTCDSSNGRAYGWAAVDLTAITSWSSFSSLRDDVEVSPSTLCCSRMARVGSIVKIVHSDHLQNSMLGDGTEAQLGQNLGTNDSEEAVLGKEGPEETGSVMIQPLLSSLGLKSQQRQGLLLKVKGVVLGNKNKKKSNRVLTGRGWQPDNRNDGEEGTKKTCDSSNCRAYGWLKGGVIVYSGPHYRSTKHSLYVLAYHRRKVKVLGMKFGSSMLAVMRRNRIRIEVIRKDWGYRTNDAFVTITLGKLKFQTSVKEKSPPDVDWNEECELLIPKQGNTAEVVLTVLHRNFLAVDEFLGVLNIPLKDFDVYERPRIRWYRLQNKPGKEKTKPRGELEVRIGFIVKAGSLIDLSKKEKNKSSLGHLSQMASSVGLKIGRKDKKGKADLLNVGSSITQKSFQKAGDADPGVLSEGESEDEFAFDDLSHDSSASSLNAQTTPAVPKMGSLENLKGGELLHKSSKSPSTGLSTPPIKNKLRSSAHIADKNEEEWEQKLYGKHGKDHVLGTEPLNRRSWEGTRLTLSSQPEEEEPQEEFGRHNSSRPSKPRQILDNIYDTSSNFASGNATDKEKKIFTKNLKSIRIGTIPEVVGADDQVHRVENNIKSKLMESGTKSKNLPNKSNNMDKPIEEMNREELFVVISDLQKTVASQNKKMKELENYLDNLLLRVMETTPRLLQNPYVKKSESKY
uniref:Uncharacterized protein n=1 Tax=Timema monikensis TaxID=170555 RepID=A0A7R9HNG4_9NEOP|nr:unnamed protein product [Timema monikensis]